MHDIIDFLDTLSDYGVTVPADKAEAVYNALAYHFAAHYSVSFLPGQAAMRLGDRLVMLDTSLIPVTAIKS